MASYKEPHDKNRMRVISKKYVPCKCGNDKGVCQTYCTIYDNKGEKETKSISEEIICKNCKI